ncbi:phosphodiester glycosidase family protein [Pseudonocardia sp. N23]|uniref:phosphodiester glycosidase family protein n=1 Tax=Pseudonocardia sp. N23 TaxID=1987376 RepID=UPI000C02D0E0|nr:phosphodiester glycosidase family protein [Pseudonocardia sp. N23]GAY13062.1 hypothetical protein TOK_1791 [Pseudonocardia sp. N23]
MPVTVSYIRALTYPGNASVLVRTVEWVRDHGGAPLVNAAENVYYRLHAPADGPPDPQALPSVSHRVPSSGVAPAGLRTLVSPSLPGEGQWQQASAIAGKPASAFTTFLRPDPAHASVVAGVARFDQNLVATRLIAGTREPNGLGWPGDSRVPAELRASLIATFNSGFKMKDANGGFAADGRTAGALRDGAASAVIDTAGKVRIGAWGRDVGPGPDVAAVRQNLELVIDHGQIVPGLDVNAGGKWGSSSNQLQYTWRSGLGVTADNGLVYVGGAGLTLSTLTVALADAGAVSAMELDIHPQMVDAFTYDHVTHLPEHLSGTPLLPSMPGPKDRYLQSDQRDFFAVTAR